MSLSHIPITFEKMLVLGKSLHVYLTGFRDSMIINREQNLARRAISHNRNREIFLARELAIERSLLSELYRNQVRARRADERRRLLYPTARAARLLHARSVDVLRSGHRHGSTHRASTRGTMWPLATVNRVHPHSI